MTFDIRSAAPPPPPPHYGPMDKPKKLSILSGVSRALIFMKFFRCRPIFFRGKPYSGVNAILFHPKGMYLNQRGAGGGGTKFNSTCQVGFPRIITKNTLLFNTR